MRRCERVEPNATGVCWLAIATSLTHTGGDTARASEEEEEAEEAARRRSEEEASPAWRRLACGLRCSASRCGGARVQSKPKKLPHKGAPSPRFSGGHRRKHAPW